MIRITIDITDTPLPDGQFYGRIEATHENVGTVSNHEYQIRDLIMSTLQEMATKFVQSEGITKSIIAKVPLGELRRRKNDNRGDTRGNPGTMR
jgi:hypothetical protein